ncbi:hypothetical protein C8R46DRAFT_1223885 [Mycena filopes]|nr:hypothetical protein C8R46DRAFT_1223885 [Mycena filopes]
MKRSGCQLKTLLLHNARIRGPELIDFLRIAPSLEVLELTGSKQIPNSFTDSVLLALGPAGDILAPALRQLVLVGTYLFTTTLLLSTLEYRFGPDERCETLRVIDLKLPDRVFSTSGLGRVAALPVGIGSRISLECLDEDRNWVRISNGRWLR